MYFRRNVLIMILNKLTENYSKLISSLIPPLDTQHKWYSKSNALHKEIIKWYMSKYVMLLHFVLKSPYMNNYRSILSKSYFHSTYIRIISKSFAHTSIKTVNLLGRILKLFCIKFKPI